MQRIDLHVHSEKSFDGFIKLNQIQKLIKKKNLWNIAITDHNIFTKVDGLIPGIEIKSNIGDVLILFIKEKITVDDVNEILDKAKEMDAFTILPHPWRSGKFLQLNELEQKKLATRFSAIEVLNGRSNKDNNLQARKFAKKFRFKMVAGSDAHSPSELGTCGIQLSSDVDSIEEIKKALINGKYTIFGSEIRQTKRIISMVKGKYKKEGVSGVLKAGIKKVRKK